MAAFFRNLLATLVGLFIFSILAFFIMIGIISVMASSGDEVKEVKEKTVLYMPLSGMMVEQVVEDPFGEIMGNSVAQVGIRETIKSIEAAAEDDKIKGIYIETKYLSGSFASLQEIRDALLKFKDSGKFIYAYGDYMSESDYYVASAADSIYMHPQGSLEFNGLAVNMMFYKGLFEKLDIDPVIFRVGQYKSYVEPYTRKDMSEENKLQYSELLNSIYNVMLDNISASRGVERKELEKLSDEMLIQFPEDAKRFGMVSNVLYEDEVKDLIREKLEVEKDKEIYFLTVAEYFETAKLNVKSAKDKIAVIVASGDIMPSGDDEVVGGEQFARYIKKAREDKNVKAIVLRINSPGGSLLGSDIIWREVMLTKGVKPIISSMGGVAASGGYYIAMATDTIVAQPNTITGSIGIFSMLFNFERFLDNKLGLTHDVVGTGQYSDFITVTRPFTPYESQLMQNGVEEGYRTFTTKVAEGRNMKVEDVLAIAGGRVWTGVQAKENGLVDVLGSYDDAIELAAKAAGIEEYSLRMYPAKKSFFEKLMEDIGPQTRAIFQNDHILAPYEKQLRTLKGLEGIQARLAGDIQIQ